MFGSHEVSAPLRRRLYLGASAAAMLLLLLLTRLWVLQVLRGEEMAVLSEHNRIRLRRIAATRGRVVDRHGRVLVESDASFDAVLVREDAPDLENTAETLANFLNQSAADVQDVLNRAAGRPPFEEIVVKRDLAWEEVRAIETHQTELPGVSVRISPQRHYREGETLAHVLGYVGEVSREDIQRDPFYRPGDLIGKSGLEKVFDEQLRGVNGGRQVEVDALGRQLRVINEEEALPGHTLVLSIDLDLQRAAENALGDREGAVVAIDPNNGDVLAMASRPSFDPNQFTRGIAQDAWRKLVSEPTHPLTHRALQGQYPPGSTFKFIVATAGLAEGVINPFNHITCHGSYHFGRRDFRCWRAGGHGSVDLRRALAQSCDVFFYQVGQRLGVDTIARYARMFGLGAPSGIALGAEKSGLIPDSEWKKRRFGEPWYPGETLPVAIGQGYVTATPLQMARAVATLASGTLYRPRVVLRLEGSDGAAVQTIAPHADGKLPVKKSFLDEVRGGMEDVVNSPGGTGKKAALSYVTVAGKTGTSQVVALGHKRVKAAHLPREQRDHAWFVAFAPVEKPQIALAVLVEHADGGGGAIAAPVAREVMEEFFELQEGREAVRYAAN